MFGLGRPPFRGTIHHTGDQRKSLRGTCTPVRASKDELDVQKLLQKFREGGDGVKVPRSKTPAVLPQKSEDIEKDAHPARNLNQYGLEFFDVADFAEINDIHVRTARPIKQKGVVRMRDAGQALKQDVDAVIGGWVEEMIASGELDEGDVDQFMKELDEEGNTKEIRKVLKELDKADKDIPDPDPDLDPQVLDDMSQIESLMYDWHIPNFLHFEEGEGGLPVACLAHPNGERLRIHLQGACITSWKRFDGREAFLVRPDAVFEKGERINSGLTLAFPQYDFGGLPFDGFAGQLMWEVVHAEIKGPLTHDPAPSITLRCSDTEHTRKMWPHKFEMFYKITLSEQDDAPSNEMTTAQKNEMMREELESLGRPIPEHLKPEPVEEEPQRRPYKSKRWAKKKKRLIDMYDLYENKPPGTPSQITMQFTVKNLGDEPMEFLCATKPHFRVNDLRVFPEFVSAVGLGGKPYLDYNISSGRPRLRNQTIDYTLFKTSGPGTHAIYMDCELGEVLFCPGNPTHYKLINRAGFPDIVAIQPGDQTPELFKFSRFLVVLGRGRLTVPIRLEPGEEWNGETALRFHDRMFNEPVFGFQNRAPQGYFPPKPPSED